MTVSKDLLKAIKKGDTVVFSHSEGKTRGWVIKQNPKFGEPFEDYELPRFEFECPNMAMTNFTGREDGLQRIDPISFSGSVQHDQLVLLRHMLREGDTLQPYWVVGNNSQTINEVQLRADEFHLRIRRGEGTKAKELEIRVGYTLRPYYARECFI